jgi:hypothetical protein
LSLRFLFVPLFVRSQRSGLKQPGSIVLPGKDFPLQEKREKVRPEQKQEIGKKGR